MKKVYISIASLLLCGSMLMAQSPANKLINDLRSTGEEGVLMLINKINAP